jgi:indole-3-glycerol phosphate synthase
VYESAAAGADAILLIVAAMHPEDLHELYREARGLDLDVMVEVHDERSSKWRSTWTRTSWGSTTAT